MKSVKFTVSLLLSAFIFINASSQNVLINILTQKSGVVKVGENVFLEVTINNTDPVTHIGIYKIKTQISVPSSIAAIPVTGHILPTGWTITSNDGATINISNGKDMIAATDARTILIMIKGKAIGGYSTIAGQLTFSDGNEPGTSPGILKGDNPGDNSSTSTIKVHK